MGYYTDYSIAFFGPEERIESFKKDLLDASIDDRFDPHEGKMKPMPNWELETLLDDGYVNGKLYDISNWIDDVAPHYPDVLVALYGDGESSDDMWESRWKGMESERHQAEIPPFTNENLFIPHDNK